ncbi:MFS transporter [Metabacillus herbersteinensis]|uniref:MFS transporter n=1 Tax=Metabacillus herbersteinensis TaxID=283816 RepID=A0ABV6GMK6_9BACI
MIDISIGQYSILWTINGALIVLAAAKTIKQQIIVGIFIFILSFIVVSSPEQFTGFVVAMIIMTLGEMLVWPAVPTIAGNLAPKGKEGFYQGFVNSTATGGRMIGPLLGGIIVDYYDITLLFAILVGLLVVGICITSVYDKKMKTAKSEEVAMIS